MTLETECIIVAFTFGHSSLRVCGAEHPRSFRHTRISVSGHRRPVSLLTFTQYNVEWRHHRPRGTAPRQWHTRSCGDASDFTQPNGTRPAPACSRGCVPAALDLVPLEPHVPAGDGGGRAEQHRRGHRPLVPVRRKQDHVRPRRHLRVRPLPVQHQRPVALAAAKDNTAVHGLASDVVYPTTTFVANLRIGMNYLAHV